MYSNLKSIGASVAVFIAAVTVFAVIGKMVSECAGCMNDWEG